MRFCHIAVPTKSLKSFGIAELAKLYVKRTTAYIVSRDFASVLVSSSIDVVNGKKSWIVLTTTGAFFSIMSQDVILKFLEVPTISRLNLFRVFGDPFTVNLPFTEFVCFSASCSPFGVILFALGALSFALDRLGFAATNTKPVLFVLIVACFVVVHDYSIHRERNNGNKKAAQWPLQIVESLSCLVADVVGGVVIGQHRLAQGFGLSGRRLQFDLGNQFHAWSIPNVH